MKKRILSILTALVLCLTLLPAVARAEGSDVASVTVATTDDPTGTPTNYLTFEAALTAANAAEEGKTVTLTLLDDCRMSGNQTITRSMTLDLGGKKLFGNGNSDTLIIDNSATVTIQGNGETVSNGVNCLNIKLTANAGSTLTIASGKFRVEVMNYGTATINGGTFNMFSSFGTLTVEGGTFDSAFQNFGTATIKGGTFNGAVSNSYTDTPARKGTLTITGGTFNKPVNNSTNADTLTLKGGTFKDKIRTYRSGETVQDLLATDYGYRYYNGGDALKKWYQEETTSVTPGTGESICVKEAPFKAAGITPATCSLTCDYDEEKGFTATTTGQFDNPTHQWYLGTDQDTLFADGNTAGGSSAFFYFPTGKSIGTYYVGCAITVDGYTLKSNIATVTVSKATPTIAVSITGWTYGDTANAPTVTGAGTATVTIEYKLKTAADDAYSETVPTAAGEYTVRATVDETDTLAAASDTAHFTIAPKAATITALNKTGKVYDPAPDLSSPVVDKDYTIEGLLDGDTVAVTLTCDADMSRQGEYDIIPSATNPNYDFTFVPGKLTLTYQHISQPTTYAVAAPITTNGTVKVSPRYAERGDTVTITVTPDSGYTLETLTVLDKNGKEIELTDKGDGKYAFKMPTSKVTVTATFAEDNSMLNFFVDVTADKYYYDAVLWAAKNGITGGIDENHFGPDQSCTRAQLVTFLWRAAGCPVVNYAMDFSDVGDGYYTEAVRWAASLGIVGGYGNGLFGSNDTITREQMATILYRFAQTQGNGFSGAWAFRLNFEDVSELSDWAVEGVSWCVMNDIMQGYDNNLMPKAECTRAQIVTMLYRLLGA